MKNIVVKYGLIAGLILAVYILIAMQFMSAETDMTTTENVGNTFMFLILGATIFIGLKKYRDEELGGSITFGKVFVKGLLITLLAGIIYSLAWTIASEISDTNYSEMMIEMTMREMQESGASDEEISITIEQIEAFIPYYEMPANKFFITILEPLMPGVFASLILGFVLKKKKVEIESTDVNSSE